MRDTWRLQNSPWNILLASSPFGFSFTKISPPFSDTNLLPYKLFLFWWWCNHYCPALTWIEERNNTVSLKLKSLTTPLRHPDTWLMQPPPLPPTPLNLVTFPNPKLSVRRASIEAQITTSVILPLKVLIQTNIWKGSRYNINATWILIYISGKPPFVK